MTTLTTPIPSLLLLPKIFSFYPEIEAVYLFGSRAEGRTRPDSDLDLAVYPGDPCLAQKKIDILTRLAEIGFCNVDLIFLDGKDILLNFEAIKHNHIVYQKADFDRGEVFSKIVRQYFDFLPYLAYQRQVLKARLLHG